MRKFCIVNLILSSFFLCSLFEKSVAGENEQQQTYSTDFIKGADISFALQIEDLGGKYFDKGAPKDILKIFKDYDFNYIRLKLWHTPEEDYNNLKKILVMAKRIKDNDLKFLLNFHYSDTWADPGKQIKPKAWQQLSYEVLKDSVYQYTKNVIAALYAQGTLPDMIQIGNEITPGMLWNDGRVGGSYETSQQWKQLGELIKSGIQGVRESCENGDSVKIMIHLDRGGDNSSCRWFFNNLNNQGVVYDVIGLSFYPWWHGTLNQLKNNLNDLATRYKKDIIVVETAYPWTLKWYDSQSNIVGDESKLHSGYPATVEGQTQFFKDLISIIKNTNDNKGAGLFYWEPEYISVQPIGSPWENLTLFDFSGNTLSSFNAFVDVSSVVDAREKMILTKAPILLPNYPNPFNNHTKISYIIDNPNFVRLNVFNLQGKLLTTLTEKFQAAGQYSITWDAKVDDGAPVASGIYLVSLEVGARRMTQKVMLLK